ncbi:ATP-binding protein [Streptomyces sp. NPDC056987]|uniref:ATP-binding protein n=1 Tax=Streptomyces sp. NPDC056987 TaxID=3345988 RepID=UPI0036262E74
MRANHPTAERSCHARIRNNRPAACVTPRFAQCPPLPQDPEEPVPGNLGYGLALPSAVATPAIAREAAEVILDVHCVADALIDPALRLVRELVAYACRFTASGEQVHLALHHDPEGALRITVHDTHAVHTHPRLAAVCDERRLDALEGVPGLVEAHHGSWGFGAAHRFAGAGRGSGVGTCTPRRWAA